jgi:hypothetical protein
MLKSTILRLAQLAILLVFLSQIVLAQTRSGHTQSLFYGDVTWNIERNKLDNFADRLKFNKDTIGFIFYNPGEKDCLIDVKRRIDRAVKYLTTKQKISKDRITTLYAGHIEALTVELRLVTMEELKDANLKTNYKENLNDYIKADVNCKTRRKIVKRKKTLGSVV